MILSGKLLDFLSGFWASPNDVSTLEGKQGKFHPNENILTREW